MNEMTEHGEHLPNKELLKKMIAAEIPLPDVSSEIKNTQSKILLSNLTALGVGFEPIASMVQQITSGGRRSADSTRLRYRRERILHRFKMEQGCLVQLSEMQVKVLLLRRDSTR